MQAMIEKLLGASWGTSALGYAIALLTELDVFTKNEGFPTTLHGWIQMGMGVLAALFGRMTKQYNVSNAKTPGDAKPVPTDVVS